MALISNPVPNTTRPETEANLTFEGLASLPHVKVVIRPGGPGPISYFRELFEYRELLYFLASREVKVRYKQSVLGVAWALLQPLFAMFIFTIFFGRLAHMPSDGVRYEIFVYAALVPWIYFSNAINASANSVVTNSNLITKVYFPRIIVPLAAVLAGWIDFAMSLLVLLALGFYYKVDWTWRLATLPILILLLSLLAIAIGSWMAAMNVRYRDVRHALPFFVQAWMFLTPIIYPASLVPPSWRWLLKLNPLTGILQAFRAATVGQEFDLASLAISIGLTFILLCFALYSFRSMERSFADIL